MPFNSIVTRTNADVLIPVEVSNEIIQGVPTTSAIMQLATKLPNMGAKQKTMPVLSSLLTAYFVDGEAGDVTGEKGLKQTTSAAWANKTLTAEELAVIVPIPEAVLSDSTYDIWGELKPRIIEAFGKAFDQAVLYGTNAPSTWPTNILAAALAAGNSLALGAGGVDLYDDILGELGILAKIEADGYDVNGHVAATIMKSKLRGLRDANGVPIFSAGMKEANTYVLDGSQLVFPVSGAIVPASSLMISGDWKQLVYSIRQDVTYKVFDQGVVTDNNGLVIYNLMQQDMVALRCTMRLAWQLPNPINSLQPVEANRYPFGVLTPA